MSGTIEHNVIILDFDGSGVKKGTEETMKSLDALNAKINGSNSGQGLGALSKVSKVYGLSSLIDSAETVGKRFKWMGVVGMTAVNKLTNGAIDAGIKIAKALPGDIISGGFTRAHNIEKAQFLIEGLGFKWKATAEEIKNGAKDVYTAVDKSVTGTAYTLDQAATLASQFLGSGLTDMDQLQTALESVSGVSAILSADYSRIGLIFSQVAGQGRLMGDDLLQLNQAGLGAASVIKDYLNENKDVAKQALDTAIANGKMKKSMEEISTHSKLTEADIREMVSAGAISFDILTNATHHFFDQAIKANDTYSGSLSNLRSAFNRMGAVFEEAKLKNMTRIFNALIPVVNRLKEILMPVLEGIGKASTKTTDIIVKMIGSLGEAMGMDLFDEKNGPFFRFANGLSREAKKVEKTNDKLSKSNDKTAHKFMVTAKEWQAAQDVWYKGSYGTGQKRADEIRKLGMSYENVQGIINEFYRVGFKWEKVDHGIIKSTKDKTKANKEAAESTEDLVFSYPPLVTALKTFGSAVKAGVNFLKGFKNIGKVVVEFWKTTFGKAIQGSAKHLMNWGERIEDLGKRFKNFSKDFKMDAFEKIHNEIGPKVFAAFQKIGEALEFMHEKLSAGWDKLKEFFEMFKESEGFEKLASSISTLVDKVKELAGAGLDRVVGSLKELGSMAFEGASLDNVVNFFSSIANGLAGVIDRINSGQNPFKGFFGNLKLMKKWFSFKWQARDAIGTNLSNAIDYPNLSKTVNQIGNLNLGGKVLSNANNLSKFLTKTSEALDSDNLQGFKENIFKDFKEGDLDKMSKILLRFVSIGGIIKGTHDMSKAISSFVGISKSISGLFGSLTDISKSISQQIRIESFKTLAIAIALITASIVALAAIPKDRMIPAAAAVATIMGIMTGILALTTSKRFDPRAMLDVGIAFAGIGVAMALIAGAVAKLGKLEPDQLARGGAALIAFMGILTAVSFFAKRVSGLGMAFVGMALAVTALVGAVQLFAMMDPETFAAGMGKLVLAMASLALAVRLAGRGAKGCASFFAIAAALYALIPAIILMALIPTGKAIQGAATISGVLIALGLAARIAGQCAAGLKTMAALSSTIAVLTASLVVLSFLDPDRLLKSVLALMSVLATVALSGAIASSAKAGLAMMIAVIAALAGAIAMIVMIDADKGVAVATGLAKFAAAMSLAMLACAAVGAVGIASLIGLGLFLVWLGVLAGIVAAISKIADNEGAMKKIDKFGDFMQRFGHAIGQFGAGMAAGFAENLGDSAKELKKFTDVFIPVINSLSNMNVDGVKALRDLAEAILMITGGGIMDKISSKFGSTKGDGVENFGESLDSLAETFIPFIRKLSSGEGIGKAAIEKVKSFGEAVKVFADVAGALPKTSKINFLGFKGVFGDTQELDEFAGDVKKAAKSITKAGEVEIDKGKLSKVGLVGEAITTISDVAKKLPKSGTWPTLSGKHDLGAFASDLGQLVPKFKLFSDAANGEGLSAFGDLSNVKTVATAVTNMAEAAKAIPENTSGFHPIKGKKEIGAFASDLASMAPGFKTFSEALAGEGDNAFSNFKGDAVKNVASAVTSMAEAAASIPESVINGTGANLGAAINGKGGTGGLAQFAEELGSFVTPFYKFSYAVGTHNKVFSEENLNIVGRVGDALAKFADVKAKIASVVEKTGGSLFDMSAETGDSNGLDTFGSSLESLSGNLTTFIEKTKNIVPKDIEDVAGKIESVTKMFDAFKGMGSGEGVQIPDGADLVTFAENMNTFNSKMTTVTLDESKIGTIATYLEAFKTKLEGIDVAVITEKANVMTKVSEALSSFQGIGSIPTGKNMISLSENVKTFCTNLQGAVVDGITEKADKVKNAVKKLVSAAKSAVEKGGEMSGIVSAGSNIGNQFVAGVNTGKKAAEAAGKALAAKAVSGAGKNSYVNKMKSIGKALGDGVAKGLREAYDSVAREAEKIIKKANEAARAAADMNSPSKLFAKIGRGLGEGLVVGMAHYGREVYHASYDMASESVKAANAAMYNLEDYANPTITPVIDLSQVRKGTRAIDSMVSSSKAIGINASVNSSATRYATPGMVSKLYDKINAMSENAISVKVTDGMSGAQFINNITVDGAENPEDFASRFVHQLQMEMRTI